MLQGNNPDVQDDEKSTPDADVKNVNNDDLDGGVDVDKKVDNTQPNESNNDLADAINKADDSSKVDSEVDFQPVKIRNTTLKTKDELIEFAQKQSGEVSRLSGELNKSSESKEPQKIDTGKLRWEMKVEDFFDENPEAVKHKETISVFIRSGQANENGKPSLTKAYNMVQKALGKDVIETTPDNNSNNLKVGLQSGSGVGGGSAPSVDSESKGVNKATLDNVVYKDEEQVKNLKKFTNNTLLSRMR